MVHSLRQNSCGNQIKVVRGQQEGNRNEFKSLKKISEINQRQEGPTRADRTQGRALCRPHVQINQTSHSMKSDRFLG
jgi:hypothetical protein